jgi:catechol 2,3-dioxygenase-like lactoylglutathione lyase family enzyme
MIAGGNATLLVSEMDRAVRFYVETLGFKLRGRAGEEWAEVDAGGGLVLGLLVAGGQRPGESGPGARGSISIGLQVNQPIAEVVEVLANRGVQFPRGVKEEASVKLAYFGDPDGNALYLVETSTS